jgi:hypothetical protein
MHMRHSMPSMAIVSLQNSPAVNVRLPDCLASINAFDSGKHMRTRPTAIEIPAELKNDVSNYPEVGKCIWEMN